MEVGVLKLNRNPENHFAEVEQAALDPANIVPGIAAGDLPKDPWADGERHGTTAKAKRRRGTARTSLAATRLAETTRTSPRSTRKLPRPAGPR